MKKYAEKHGEEFRHSCPDIVRRGDKKKRKFSAVPEAILQKFQKKKYSLMEGFFKKCGRKDADVSETIRDGASGESAAIHKNDGVPSDQKNNHPQVIPGAPTPQNSLSFVNTNTTDIRGVNVGDLDLQQQLWQQQQQYNDNSSCNNDSCSSAVVMNGNAIFVDEAPTTSTQNYPHYQNDGNNFNFNNFPIGPGANFNSPTTSMASGTSSEVGEILQGAALGGDPGSPNSVGSGGYSPTMMLEMEMSPPSGASAAPGFYFDTMLPIVSPDPNNSFPSLDFLFAVCCWWETVNTHFIMASFIPRKRFLIF